MAGIKTDDEKMENDLSFWAAKKKLTTTFCAAKTINCKKKIGCIYIHISVYKNTQINTTQFI